MREPSYRDRSWSMRVLEHRVLCIIKKCPNIMAVIKTKDAIRGVSLRDPNRAEARIK